MANTQFPTRPQRSADAGQVAWTVWQMLQYFVNSVYDVFQNKFFQGSATVAAGNTSVVVPVATGVGVYQVHLTPTNDPTVRYWVSAKSTINFTITLSAAAPVGGAVFDWYIKVP